MKNEDGQQFTCVENTHKSLIIKLPLQFIYINMRKPTKSNRSSSSNHTPRNKNATPKGNAPVSKRSFSARPEAKEDSTGNWKPKGNRPFNTSRNASGSSKPESSRGKSFGSKNKRSNSSQTDTFSRKPRVDKKDGESASEWEPTRGKSFGANRKTTDSPKTGPYSRKPLTDKKEDYSKSAWKSNNTRDNKRGAKPTGKTKYARNKKAPEETELISENTGNSRLNKFIANAGICSRREADKLIGAGLVSVNGKIITEMGFQVKPGDDVRYNGTRLSNEKKVYIIMNKSRDTITTLDDPEGRKTVTEALAGSGLPRVYPVGRLDRNTTGVLLLTNDGELAQRLMHPKYEVQKIYKATLDKNLKGQDLWTLTNGIELEDGPIKPDSIAVPDPKEKNVVVVEIHSGRNRIIHRTFEHLGYKVDKLDRIWYAGLDKRALKRGQWRELNDRELSALKKLVKLK
jgi:23S rRNA pseudouridine2605 synthase